MSIKRIDKLDTSLSGQLEKLSTSLLIGYQTKFFSLLENGTKIGYRNLQDKKFDQDKIFLIKDVGVCEAEDQHSFTLETPKRSYTLKAKDQQTKLIWMRTIVSLRKLIIRRYPRTARSPHKQKPVTSTTDNTLPNISISFLNETQRSMESVNLRMTERSGMVSLGKQMNCEKEMEMKLKELGESIKNVPECFVKYNVFVTRLRTKVDNLFTASYTQSTYILLSSKSLFPGQAQSLSSQNLTNMMLPPWAQVNKLYRVHSNNQGSQPQPKLLLEISKIIDIEQPKQEKTSIRIRTSEVVYTFYSRTVQQKDRIKEKIKVAMENYREVLVNGKLMRRNYDQLLRLYTEKYDQFLIQVKNILKTLLDNQHQQFSTPKAVAKIDQIILFIEEFLLILSTKKTKQCNEMILHTMKQLHQDTKILIKLTWDTCYHTMSTTDILKFLNALAAYHLKTKELITDVQFLSGMKELSKVYVRCAWKNFQDIILGIVEQEKKANFFKDEDNEFVQTNAIVDLFKFLHEVFDLAAPCWEHRLHLHNVQRLMYRAVQVYINELKGAVDETVMADSQLIAIGNNYFRFSITVDEFYTEKFSSLQERTKQNWEKLKSSYKQLSNIILDRLAFDARGLIRKFFEKSAFFSLNIHHLSDILKQCSENISIDTLHPVFMKRFYQKLFTTIKQGVLSLLQKEVSSKKKKHNVSKILQSLQSITFDLVDMSQALFGSKSRIDRQLNEVNILLSCENHNELVKLVRGAGEDTKRVYMNIVNLREDYYMGGPLYQALNYTTQIDQSSIAGNSLAVDHRSTMRHTRLTISMQRQLRASISSYYINNDFDTHSSVDNRSQQEYEEKVRLISEGYLMKCKANKKEYFRLKNGVLYFYQSEKSEKCQHSIPVVDMTRIYFEVGDGLGFGIEYVSLHREKQVQFRCESVELRERWVESLALELKRVKNDEKVKRQRLKLNQKSKNQLIIDYEELLQGKGYFSYTNSAG